MSEKKQAGLGIGWIALAIASVFAIVIAIAFKGSPQTVPKKQLAELGFYMFDSPRELTPVTLNNLQGEEVTLESFDGQWRIVNFGYISCPDICPINLSFLANVQDHWDKSAADKPLQVLHITFDPKRDTPKLLGDYLAYMHETFIGLTGQETNIKQVAQQLNMVFIKEKPNEQGDYFISHSDSMALIDPQGRYVGLVKGPYDFDNFTKALSLLVGS